MSGAAKASDSPLVLWDIDGTLVHETRGEGSRMQMRAIHDVLGIDLERPGFGAGATERMVWTRLFEHAQLPVPEDLTPLESAIDALYVDHFAEVPRVAIPGAAEAVATLAAAGFTNSVLTGNGRPVSRLKLESAGFDVTLFDWDAAFFGREWSDRVEMAKAARARHPSAVIIGDTVNDGACAVGSGIPWVAVGTGGHPRDELERFEPVAWFDDLVGRTDELVRVLRDAVGYGFA
ncbi:HAD family hydrolase [Gryllotalpicola reticulitermitis]|uniref:HAD family hydrolase n=1 Tax=Gryllotalpicola reticulitermitis TaxID=1184153 RepID=A0ABV8QAD3_9MICO